MQTQLSDKEWIDLAKSLDIDVPVLRAVADVESSGSGFLPRTAKPKVLFEGHVFHRLTGARFDGDRPDLSYAKWTRSKYSGSLAGEWKRLDAACQLDRAAALQSASWGLYQIMGFNYVYCGCSDVEAFVARQYAGVPEQVALFARFIARPPFLAALRARDWKTFAAAYNGPGYAQNNYHGKLKAAYQAAAGAPDTARGRKPAVKPKSGSKSGAKSRRKQAGGRDALPPGRESFAAVPSVRRQRPLHRNVRPDPVDLRDWEYRPAIAVAPTPTVFPGDPRSVKQQAETNACTGFALATVIEYLLERANRAEKISGFMLYSMARRYDEWSDEDENDDSGSSLRGALKGWARHGACTAALWDKMKMPPAPKRNAEQQADWWLDAVKRPMGAYYRIAPANIRDMHVALTECGVIYASALTHSGWDALLGADPCEPPTDIQQLPVIKDRKGGADQGHAFAIVGYTPKGFIVHNSWGGEWGFGGFALLQYSDWLRNAMDCWVVQLGVVTAEHDAVSGAVSLRVEGKGRAQRAVISDDTTLADHEISPFVINMGNEGLLSSRGRFRTKDDDLDALVTTHLELARQRWDIADGDPIDIGIYAHGGLTDEDAAAKTARSWIPHLYSNRIFPIFLMWETGASTTLRNLFEDLVKGEAELTAAGGRWERFKQRFEEWKDVRLEGFARFPGGKLWAEMKQNAAALSGHRQSGVIKLFSAIERRVDLAKAPIRLHLIGHSAGAVVHSHLGAQAIRRQFDLSSIAFLAPAVRLDTFVKQLGEAVAGGEVPMLIANLTDAAERTDDTCRPYGHSLLYLVSRSFEDREETPLLGMEKHLVPALATDLAAARVRQLPCPGGFWDNASAATRATTHGGLDEDAAVREAVAAFIRSIR